MTMLSDLPEEIRLKIQNSLSLNDILLQKEVAKNHALKPTPLLWQARIRKDFNFTAAPEVASEAFYKNYLKPERNAFVNSFVESTVSNFYSLEVKEARRIIAGKKAWKPYMLLKDKKEIALFVAKARKNALKSYRNLLNGSLDDHFNLLPYLSKFDSSHTFRIFLEHLKPQTQKDFHWMHAIFGHASTKPCINMIKELLKSNFKVNQPISLDRDRHSLLERITFAFLNSAESWDGAIIRKEKYLISSEKETRQYREIIDLLLTQGAQLIRFLDLGTDPDISNPIELIEFMKSKTESMRGEPQKFALATLKLIEDHHKPYDAQTLQLIQTEYKKQKLHSCLSEENVTLSKPSPLLLLKADSPTSRREACAQAAEDRRRCKRS